MKQYNWLERREQRAFLALEDGTVFPGCAFGSRRDCAGEAVFNTGMTGYQEILTDPSYAGQIVLLTAPEIGNYGVNSADIESRSLFLKGLLVRELNAPSNFRSEDSLGDYLARNNIPGLAGLDTRRLTLHLRDRGSMKGYLHVSDMPMTPAEGVEAARCLPDMAGMDMAGEVSTRAVYDFSTEGGKLVAVYDYGVKTNILRQLAARNFRVRVFPASAPAPELLACRPDGVFLSNGPGDPAGVVHAVENIRVLLGKVPVMGICLGHQLLGLACGGVTVKLKFGHHGCNHPVRDLRDGSVAITSQNHNYALESETLPECLEVTHLNLNDGTVEGIRHKTLPAFSVQYHPEAAPGPFDAQNLFDRFEQII